MRDIVLQRLETFKHCEGGFLTGKWTNIFISCSLGKNLHVSKIELEKLERRRKTMFLNIFRFPHDSIEIIYGVRNP
jgi:hypothetical protein